MRKIKIFSELYYVAAILILSFAVNLMAVADFGMATIVGPAYILSQKIGPLTYGQAEYIVAGLVFVIFCLRMPKIKVAYFSSFITGFLYGTAVDLWEWSIPLFHEGMHLSISTRIVLFIVGMLLTALAIALFMETYLYPQIYDLFVKVMSRQYKIDLKRFKIGFDFTFFVISVILSFVLFRRFVGIGIGTIIMVFLNGILISMFQKFLTHYVDPVPYVVKLSVYLDGDMQE